MSQPTADREIDTPAGDGARSRPAAAVSDAATAAVDRAESAASAERDRYAGDADRPVGSYALLLGAYGFLVAGMAAFTRWRGTRLPERIDPGDLALMSVATHKLSRLVAKDPVTSPLRMPFTRYEGTSGPSELHEEVRGSGLRHAAGELVTCPFCIGQWTATGFAFGLVHAPRATRLAAAVFAALTASDFLQLAYAKASEKAG